MGCKQAWLCCSCLLSITLIGSSIFEILLSQGTLPLSDWNTLEKDSTIQSCIQSADVNVEAPDPIEIAVLQYLAYSIIGVFVFLCCLALCFKDSENFGTCICCLGCLLLLVVWGSAAILLHIYIYIAFLNEAFDSRCSKSDEWKKVYTTGVIGGAIGMGLIVFQCCACYMAMFVQKQDGGSKKQVYDSTYGASSPSTYGGSPSVGSTYGGSTYGGPTTTNQRLQSNTEETEMTVAVRGNNYNTNDPGSGDLQLSDQEREVLARVLISAELIEQCGFSIASRINKAILLEVIKHIKPDGSTALRDAVALGVVKMLSLKLVLNKLGVIGHQFIHIVLTDGADNSSESSLRDIQDLYRKIGAELGSQYFKTFFIGIDLGSTEKRDLQSIADLAGDSAELFHCNDVQLSDVFDRIKVSIGIHRRMALVTDGTNFVAASQDRLFLQAERQKFLVLFDLDMSGSMSGHRWNRLQGALGGFFNTLDDSDIIGCVLFNQQAVCITGEALNNATR